MTPLPVTPKVVILIDADGTPLKVASNIAPLPELNVEITRSERNFADLAAGKPFNQSMMIPSLQV